MLSKPSIAVLFTTVALVVIASQQVFGQAAPAAGKTERSIPITRFKPIDPVLVAADEAEAAADKKRTQERKKAYTRVRKVLGGQIPLDDVGKKILDDWYKGYFLPNFTSPENLSELPELRKTLLSKDLRPAKSAAAAAYVRKQVMTYMKAFAQSPGKYDFYPAVRYNAMLLIGSLNAVEYNARYADNSKALVPEPLGEALDLLIAEYKSPTQIDAVRVAALIGIDRHVKLDLARPTERRIPGRKKKVIVDEMVALLNAAPPAGRSAAGHTWMQRRGIDILAALGMVGPYAPANAALEKIVADNDAPMSLRCTASEALARWNPKNKKIDASAVSKNLGLIAVKACNDELDRIAALLAQEEDMQKLRELVKKANPAATGDFGGMGSGMSGYGSGGGGMEAMFGDSAGMGGEDAAEGMDGEGEDMESMYSGMDGMEGMGGYGGLIGGDAATVPTDPRVIWSRRRLKYQLTCVKRGLEGMAIAGEASQHEKVVLQVKEAVEVALALTDPPEDKPNLEGLTESIQEGLRGLAFLAPAAAETGVDPLVELPAGELPPSAAPATPAPGAVPGEPTAPAVDPTAPADLPAGVE